MYLGENNGNLCETKNVICSQPFLKMRKFLLDMGKDFLIMSDSQRDKQSYYNGE